MNEIADIHEAHNLVAHFEHRIAEMTDAENPTALYAAYGKAIAEYNRIREELGLSLYVTPEEKAEEPAS
ncbi:MAG: hypothetical protein ACREOZ_02380 [Gloeomargaritales cyanobacterium]